MGPYDDNVISLQNARILKSAIEQLQTYSTHDIIVYGATMEFRRVIAGPLRALLESKGLDTVARAEFIKSMQDLYVRNTLETIQKEREEQLIKKYL